MVEIYMAQRGGENGPVSSLLKVCEFESEVSLQEASHCVLCGCGCCAQCPPYASAEQGHLIGWLSWKLIRQLALAVFPGHEDADAACDACEDEGDLSAPLPHTL